MMHAPKLTRSQKKNDRIPCHILYSGQTQKVFSQAAKEAFSFSNWPGLSFAKFMDSLRSSFKLNICQG